jgi:hypothetical protein
MNNILNALPTGIREKGENPESVLETPQELNDNCSNFLREVIIERCKKITECRN